MKALSRLNRQLRPRHPERASPPALAAALIQLTAVLAASAQALWLAELAQVGMSLMAWAVLEGAIACLLAAYLECPLWWRVIHLGFAPALVLALAFNPPPALSLAVLIALVGVYWSTYRTQVPLYLSTESAWREVSRLLPTTPGTRVIDLGSGLGGLVAYLAAHCPEAKIEGIEAAPLPFLLSRLRLHASGRNARIAWGDFWKLDLALYDVVHAYLSPVPMPALWEKARNEMRAGSLFLSHSFAVPGVAPMLTRSLTRGRRIYVYRIGA